MMATLHIQGAPSGASTLSLDVLLSAIPSLSRPILARVTARLIDRMDELDGDSDVEPNGDEQDGNYDAEDEFQDFSGRYIPLDDE